MTNQRSSPKAITALFSFSACFYAAVRLYVESEQSYVWQAVYWVMLALGAFGILQFAHARLTGRESSEPEIAELHGRGWLEIGLSALWIVAGVSDLLSSS